MEWINIHTSTLDSEAMLDATPEQRSTWLFLNRYCCGQENGGLIEGAKKWPDAKWQRLARISAAEVKGNSSLWNWKGQDLAINFYPVEQQLALQAKRDGAHKGGKARGRQLKAQAEASRQPMPDAQAEASAQAEAERKGREGKGMKGNERVREAHPPPDVQTPAEPEVREWARLSGVDESYAVRKFHETTERSGWVVRGKLIDWRHRFKRYWDEDRETWLSKKKSAAPAVNGRPPGWTDGDQAWWWTDPLADLERALHGALIGNNQQTAARIRVVLEERRKIK
jgi:hypothetical protein